MKNPAQTSVYDAELAEVSTKDRIVKLEERTRMMQVKIDSLVFVLVTQAALYLGAVYLASTVLGP